MSNDSIPLTLENYKSLNKAYQKAVKEGKTGKDVIVWEGRELLISYLYYMLSFFEMVEETGNYAIKHKITRKKV